MGVTSATDRNANICLAFCPPRASQGEITANCRLAIYRPDHLYTPRWDNPDFMSTDGTEDRDDDTFVSLLIIILEGKKNHEKSTKDEDSSRVHWTNMQGIEYGVVSR